MSSAARSPQSTKAENGTEEQIEALTGYGKNLGIAYQIRDDLLDWKNEGKLFNLLIKKSCS